MLDLELWEIDNLIASVGSRMAYNDQRVYMALRQEAQSNFWFGIVGPRRFQGLSVWFFERADL